MSRAKEILSLFENKVIAHIEGQPGSGKTYLMNQLRAEFPEFVFADLDNLYWETPEKQKDASLEQHQKAYEVFLKQWIMKQSKPVVLVGIHGREHFHGLKPQGKMYLSTSALGTAYRHTRRFGKLGNPLPPMEKIRDFVDSLRLIGPYRKELKGKGYSPSTPKRIRAFLKTQRR